MITAMSPYSDSKPVECASDSPAGTVAVGESRPIVLSFDVEEHDRIEAAVGLDIAPDLKKVYRARVSSATDWILDELSQRGIKGTFFVVGQIARHSPGLVRAIHEAGHEVACHSWNHRRILGMTPQSFRENTRLGKDALEQATGAAVVGFRAPTFSIVRETAWALDVLAELGFLYDSSIFPVHHDRYGIADAPRGPFLARGAAYEILELPPATLRVAGQNLPIGGGGYFRLLPSWLLNLALRRWQRNPANGSTMLYFHPWEFDPDQPRLPLKALSRFRTYVGLRSSKGRFSALVTRYSFTRAIDVARRLNDQGATLPRFDVARRLNDQGATLPRFDPAALRTRPMARLSSVAGSAAKADSEK